MTGLVNAVVLMLLAACIGLHATHYTYVPVDNNCFNMTAAASQSELARKTLIHYWTLPADNCSVLISKERADGTTASIIKSPAGGFSQTSIDVEDPDLPGHLEGYAVHGSSPYKVTTIVVYHPYGFAFAVCHFENGSSPLQAGIVAVKGATQDQITRLKTEFDALVPGVALNEVYQGSECDYHYNTVF